jgi:hypothetical protein
VNAWGLLIALVGVALLVIVLRGNASKIGSVL